MSMMLFIQFVFLLFTIPENIPSETTSLNSIRKFLVELRNDSDSMTEYVAKIQAIFCPEQPFCGALASETRQSVLNTLPETLTVENNTIRVAQLQALTDVCCLPCSCEDNCKVDNNCCLTKTFGNKTINVETESNVTSECIASTSKSYRQKLILDKHYSYYSMITQCFIDKTSSIQSHCETPDPYDMADTIPVTSLRSGRTYWNQHCAKCNNDAANMVFWNMTVIFKVGFAFYSNFYSSLFSTDREEEFYNRLQRQEIVFTPPFEMSHKRCYQKEFQKTCRKTLDNIHEDGHRFLYETCDMVSLPVISGFYRSSIRKNIFCYICDTEEFLSSDKPDCSFGTAKHSTGTMMGLLSYRHLGEKESSTNIQLNGNEQCSCNEIFDTYQGKCIPVFCPPGSFYSGCHCSESLAVFSMPILLKLKATREPSSLYPSTDVPAAKFHKALQKAVQNFLGPVSVDIVASFRPQNETKPSNSYRLYVAVVRSDFGHDTKETLKPLLDYLKSDVFLKVTTSKKRYSVRLANKIMFRDINGLIESAFDLQDQIEIILDYSEKSTANDGLRVYQEFSPILFCKLVQLDSSQFTEKNGQLFINTTTSVLVVSDYYLRTEKEARVCVDQYLPHLPSSGNIKGSTIMLLISFCCCTVLILLNSKGCCIFA